MAYYDQRLAARNLRRVIIEAFDQEGEANDDADGRTKVFAVPHYPGLFREATGRLWDLRPVEGRPSYDQLMLKPKQELVQLMLDAYDKQLAELEAQPIKGADDEEHRAELRKEIKEAKRKAGFLSFFKPKKEKA